MKTEKVEAILSAPTVTLKELTGTFSRKRRILVFKSYCISKSCWTGIAEDEIG